MVAPAVAATPIMNALVAAAARSGTPHHAFSTGTLMIPPPIPSSDDTLPARKDAAIASGTRLTRYVTVPPLSASKYRPPRTPGSAAGSRITLRRRSRLNMISATITATRPNSRCRIDCDTNCAVTPPRKLPAAVATSSSIPSFMLISCLPARPADTVLDVAITVVRLIAAAALNGNPRPRLRNGTRKTPPPRPSSAPRLPATAPAAKMISTSDAVTTGITASPCFVLQTSDFELSRLSEVAGRLLDRARLRFLFGGAIGAGEARAGVGIGDGAVIHVAELVGFDRHRPACELLRTA